MPSFGRSCLFSTGRNPEDTVSHPQANPHNSIFQFQGLNLQQHNLNGNPKTSQFSPTSQMFVASSHAKSRSKILTPNEIAMGVAPIPMGEFDGAVGSNFKTSLNNSLSNSATKSKMFPFSSPTKPLKPHLLPEPKALSPPNLNGHHVRFGSQAIFSPPKLQQSALRASLGEEPTDMGPNLDEIINLEAQRQEAYVRAKAEHQERMREQHILEQGRQKVTVGIAQQGEGGHNVEQLANSPQFGSTMLDEQLRNKHEGQIQSYNRLGQSDVIVNDQSWPRARSSNSSQATLEIKSQIGGLHSAHVGGESLQKTELQESDGNAATVVVAHGNDAAGTPTEPIHMHTTQRSEVLGSEASTRRVVVSRTSTKQVVAEPYHHVRHRTKIHPATSKVYKVVATENTSSSSEGVQYTVWNEIVVQDSEQHPVHSRSKMCLSLLVNSY